MGGIGRLQTVVGLRTDYNFLANTVKTYVELRLQPFHLGAEVFDLVGGAQQESARCLAGGVLLVVESDE